MEDEFVRMFGMPPRKQQVDAYNFFAEKGNTEEGKITIVEMPTGGGKSKLAAIAAAHTSGRSFYVCSNKALQEQFGKDSKNWRNPDDTVVIYGRNNYMCDKKVDKFLKNASQCTGRKRRIIGATKRAFAEKDYIAPKVLFCQECEKEEITDETEQEAFWDCLSSPCSCYEEMEEVLRDQSMTDEEIGEYMKHHCCDYFRQKEKSKDCKLLVMNLAYFFTMLRNAPYQINIEHTELIIIDEAHTITEHCDPIVRDSTQPTDVDLGQLVSSAIAYRGNNSIIQFPGNICNRGTDAENKLAFNCTELQQGLDQCNININRGLLSRIKDVLENSEKVVTHARKAVETKRKAVETELEHKDSKSSMDERECARIMLDEWIERIPSDIPDPFGCRMLQVVESDQSRKNSALENCSKTEAFLRSAMWTAIRNSASRNEEIDDILITLETKLGKCEDNSIKQVCDEIRGLQQVIKDVDIAKVAVRKTAWMQNTTYKEFVPTVTKQWPPNASEHGILQYTPTMALVARSLHNALWSRVQGGIGRVLLLSATIANVEEPDNLFGTFQEEMGIRTAATIRIDQAFPRDDVQIYSPIMERFNSKWPCWKRNAYRRRQLAEIQKVLKIAERQEKRNTKKSVLVLGPSANAEAVELYEQAIVASSSFAKSREHIHVTKKKREYAEFLKEDRPRPAVIYGNKSQTQGLDKPQTWCLVVITRPPNGPWFPTALEYHELQHENKKDWLRLYYYKRDQLAIQAAGRIQRIESDKGAVLVLGEGLYNKTSNAIHKAWQQKIPVKREYS